MAKKSQKKEDETKKVVAKCNNTNEVVANCNNPEEVIANSFHESDPKSSGENPQETALSQYDIEKLIVTVRGEQVLIDQDIARIYGVTTGRLNEQAKRNIARFPESFRFQLTKEERSPNRRTPISYLNISELPLNRKETGNTLETRGLTYYYTFYTIPKRSTYGRFASAKNAHLGCKGT